MCSKDSDSKRLLELKKKQKEFAAKGKIFPHEDLEELQTLQASGNGKTKRNDRKKENNSMRRSH